MSTDQMKDLHDGIDTAIGQVKSRFGKTHSMFINGQAVESEKLFTDTSPIDTGIVLGHFQQGTPQNARDAVAAARAAAPAWSMRPWDERVAMVRKLAERIRANRWELSALMGYEAGKNRLECVGDVEEAAELIAYYCDQFEEHSGFKQSMGKLTPDEENISVLRPYGVWAVISPFNFPLALAAGPAGGALVSGNTVVFKPASDTPFVGLRLYELTVEAGLPAGVFNFVTGNGNTVGQELVDSPDIDGIVFTGSKEVGMKLIRDNGIRPIPRPLVIEMGGKNPALVMGSADLDKAADGVMRSAFGAQGQKCSACSRAYVLSDVVKEFVEKVTEKTKRLTVGNPLERNVWLGPLINKAAVETYEGAIEQIKKDGGRILTGGQRLTGKPFNNGYFVEPTLVDGLPNNHPFFSEELFVPITLIFGVGSLDEAIKLANRTEYGLTAGIFSNDESEIAKFFDRVEAGTVYANRRAGATTGAWPGINPFGGWKASGSTGRGSGGPYYVQQFLREQSRVRIL